MNPLSKLAEIGSKGILTEPLFSEDAGLKEWGSNGAELLEWLKQKNGFYAFESALHVFPIGAKDGVMDLETWNRPDAWRGTYAGLADGYLFFGEDIFGNQFCLKRDGIGSFDAETGAVTHLADNLSGWAKLILSDFELHTGQRLAHAWQSQNRPLKPGERLVPKTPFVTGGEYAIQNLAAIEASRGMTFRGDLAVQIRDLPDGTQIRYSVV